MSRLDVNNMFSNRNQFIQVRTQQKKNVEIKRRAGGKCTRKILRNYEIHDSRTFIMFGIFLGNLGLFFFFFFFFCFFVSSCCWLGQLHELWHKFLFHFFPSQFHASRNRQLNEWSFITVDNYFQLFLSRKKWSIFFFNVVENGPPKILLLLLLWWWWVW